MTKTLTESKKKKGRGEKHSKKKQVAALMVKAFPKCPICGSEAGYAVSGIFKDRVQCKSCLAKWSSPCFILGTDPGTLTLVRPDREGRSRALLRREKRVAFWQHCNVEEFNRSVERKVRELVGVAYRAYSRDPEEYTRAVAELRGLGEIGLWEIVEVAAGTHGPMDQAAGLVVLGLMGEERGEQLLIGALEAQDESIRETAVASLVKMQEATGTGNAVPALIEVLKHDESPRVRASTAMALSLVKGDQRVIDALVEALHDTARPPSELISATSWLDAMRQVASSGIPLSVADQAALSLGRLGDPRGVNR